MTTQHKLLATARKPLDMRALLDNWAHNNLFYRLQNKVVY